MITNLTKNKIISETEIQCTTLLEQARGLMFRKKHNLIMTLNKEQPISLHNFFVFYPIDVILLNEHKQIIEIKHQFKPFTFYTSKNKAKYVIELAFPSTDSFEKPIQNYLRGLFISTNGNLKKDYSKPSIYNINDHLKF